MQDGYGHYYYFKSLQQQKKSNSRQDIELVELPQTNVNVSPGGDANDALYHLSNKKDLNGNQECLTVKGALNSGNTKLTLANLALLMREEQHLGDFYKWTQKFSAFRGEASDLTERFRGFFDREEFLTLLLSSLKNREEEKLQALKDLGSEQHAAFFIKP